MSDRAARITFCLLMWCLFGISKAQDVKRAWAHGLQAVELAG